MKRIISVILAIFMMILAAPAVFAEVGTQNRIDDEIISSYYDAESDSYKIIITWGDSFKVMGQEEPHWIYTSCPASFEVSEFSSDGSAEADAVLKAIQNHEPIPVGTPVELLPPEGTEDVFILETYPPQLGNVVGLKILGEPKEEEIKLSTETIVSEIEWINSHRSFEGRYPYPDGELPLGEIAVNGRLYRAVTDENGRPMALPEEEAEGLEVKTSGEHVDGEPKNDGEQTLNWDSVEYALTDDPERIAVRTSDYWDWSLFEAVKTLEDASGSSAAPVDENPKTGVSLGAAALAAMAAAAGIWVCKKRE